MNLTEHFTLDEATRSLTATRLGLNNRPTDTDVKLSIIKTAEGMERVRELLDQPIQVTSWYRGPKLNAAVKGRPTSQHCRGEAVDFVCPKFGTVHDVFAAIKGSNIQYDQLIVETVGTSAWIHISFTGNPRLVAMSFDGKSYTKVA